MEFLKIYIVFASDNNQITYLEFFTMPHITKVLGQEVGLQYQGVKDKTSGTGQASINSLLIGKFKRGRLDQPMTITAANINAMLGYDPQNPDYVTVADYLATGVPSVEVFRLIADDSNCTPTTLLLEAQIMEFPDADLSFQYNLDITENGVTRSVEDHITMSFSQVTNHGADQYLYSILQQLMIDLNFYILDDSYAFDLKSLTPPIGNLETFTKMTMKGVEGLKEKRSITLKFKPVINPDQSPLNYNLFNLIKMANDQNFKDYLMVHSCGFNSF